MWYEDVPGRFITSPTVVEKEKEKSRGMKPLNGQRILICGKGGSGKSTISTIIARILADEDYQVVLIDGDSSNPLGLSRLVLGGQKPPDPLVELFGGRKEVGCPVDDPSPLTRVHDTKSLKDHPISLKEIPENFYHHADNIFLFQVGKTFRINEGCDGPMSKVTRDFIVEGEFITLIDTEAGIEHFGRGIEVNVDMVIVVVNATYESLQLAEKIKKFCFDMHIENMGVIINDVRSVKMEKIVTDSLHARGINIIDTVYFDPALSLDGLLGHAISLKSAKKALPHIMERLTEEVKL
jgi:CO dehydrogenase maturation factor